jgi:hypothetical protein
MRCRCWCCCRTLWSICWRCSSCPTLHPSDDDGLDSACSRPCVAVVCVHSSSCMQGYCCVTIGQKQSHSACAAAKRLASSSTSPLLRSSGQHVMSTHNVPSFLLMEPSPCPVAACPAKDGRRYVRQIFCVATDTMVL